MRIDPTRPLEELRGTNAGIVTERLGRIHVMTPLREAARQCRPPKMRTVPVALRRGWLKFVYDRHMKNRKLYIDVMTGNI